MCIITGDFKFDNLVKVVSAKFLYYKITIFLFVINKYLEEDAHIGAIYRTYLCNTLSSFLLLMGYFF